MGPTSVAPLPARRSAGKALREMASGQASLDAPAWRDCSERLEDEVPFPKLLVGYRETPRAKAAAAPQDDVEVEHSRTPATAATAAEILFQRLQPREQRRWPKIAFDQRDRIGEIAAGSAMRRVEDDRRGVEQAELLVEPGNRGLDHARRAAVAAVRAVRTERDGIEVRHSRALSLPARRSNPLSSGWIASFLRSSQ